MTFDKYATAFNRSARTLRVAMNVEQKKMNLAVERKENLILARIPRMMQRVEAYLIIINKTIRHEREAERRAEQMLKVRKPMSAMMADRQERIRRRDFELKSKQPIKSRYYVVDETRSKSRIVNGPFRTKGEAEQVKRPDARNGTVYQLVMRGNDCIDAGLTLN